MDDLRRSRRVSATPALRIVASTVRRGDGTYNGCQGVHRCMYGPKYLLSAEPASSVFVGSRTSSAWAEATACSRGTFWRPRRGNLSVNLLAEGFREDTDGLRPAALKFVSCASTTACGVMVRVLFWSTGTSSSTDEMEVVLLFKNMVEVGVGGEYAREGNAIGEGDV